VGSLELIIESKGRLALPFSKVGSKMLPTTVFSSVILDVRHEEPSSKSSKLARVDHSQF